jgi:hypothetical protein
MKYTSKEMNVWLHTHHAELSAANDGPCGQKYPLNFRAETRNAERLAIGADEHIAILHVANSSA